MEAVTIEAQKAGGMIQMLLNSDKVTRSRYVDVQEKYLEQEPAFFAEWLKHIDVWIGLSGIENPKSVFADIPEDRFAKASKASQLITDMLDDSGLRGVFVRYPTEERAKINQMDFSTYEKMHWDAVNADYKQISERGQQLKKILQGAKTVRVTSAQGTDFTFSVGDRTIFIDDGIVTEEEAKEKLFFSRWATLPAGTVFMAPVETSANGKVTVPKARCRYEPLTGISFDFKNGKLQNFKAENGQTCFEETMAPYTGPKDMFGYFSIGLNPALKVMEDGADYRPEEAAGLVVIGVGDNQLIGGKNKAQQGGYGFSIVNATVAVDGKTVVKNGKLTF
jgi:leucyl aminopeptidase (aminopeptidase T)